MSKDHRGKGYMPEAVNAVCDMVFQNEMIESITLEVLPYNQASQAVGRKCGFVLLPQEDDERETRYLDGAPLDCLVLTRDRHQMMKAA